MGYIKTSEELTRMALEIRREIIKSIYKAGSGHSGGSLSAADIMSVLYFNKMNIDPENPQWDDRDRFILSKGHANPALYAALALRGFFPKEDLATLRQIGSNLSGHPACFKTCGVDMSSGSLGHGLSIGLGMTLAAGIKNKNYKTYVLIGDGELQEGANWEAAMAAAHFEAKGLIAIVDSNDVQLDGTLEEIMKISPLKEKWQAFGWQVLSVDGHNIDALMDVFDEANGLSCNGPVVIIAKTVKGKGVSFMENKAEWHGKKIEDDEYEIALRELKLEGETKNGKH